MPGSQSKESNVKPWIFGTDTKRENQGREIKGDLGTLIFV